MNTLHFIRTSAFTTTDFKSALQTTCIDDAFVFIDDGCYNLMHPLLETCFDQHSNIYVIQEHLIARAITLHPTVETCSIAQLVDLTFSYNKVITWQ